MYAAALVRGWQNVPLLPGAFLAVVGDAEVSVAGRRQGFALRDAFTLLEPGSKLQHVFLFRKPSNGPFLQTLLEHGTGGLQISACRVAYRSETDKTLTVGKGEGGLNPGAGANFPHHKDNWGAWHVNHAGRWPTNLLLIHGACTRLGQKKIPGHKGYPNGPGGKSFQYSSDKRGHDVRPDAWAGHADADGLETIDDWQCAADCPVAIMNFQSGERPATLTGRADPSTRHTNRGDNNGKSLFGGGNSHVYADSGGAARFFVQMESIEAALQWLRMLLTPPEGEVFVSV